MIEHPPRLHRRHRRDSVAGIRGGFAFRCGGFAFRLDPLSAGYDGVPLAAVVDVAAGALVIAVTLLIASVEPVFN